MRRSPRQGAERKYKEDLRGLERRLAKIARQQEDVRFHDHSGTEDALFPNAFAAPQPVTRLTNVVPRGPKPLLMGLSRPQRDGVDGAPSAHGTPATRGDREKKRSMMAMCGGSGDDPAEHSGESPSANAMPKPKRSQTKRPEPMRTLLVRRRDDGAYHALYLEECTTDELRLRLSEKCGIAPSAIQSIFWRTRKGLLVYVDDAFIEQLHDEDVRGAARTSARPHVRGGGHRVTGPAQDFVIDVELDANRGDAWTITFHPPASA